MDGSRNAHEDQTGAPGAAVWSGDGDSGGSADAGGWSRPVDLHPGGRKAPGSGRLRKLLRWNQIAAVPHGFRSSFRDWAAEETDHPREVVEAALAHVVKNKVEAAYRRTDLFERRRVLMEDWASYLAGESRPRASVRLR